MSGARRGLVISLVKVVAIVVGWAATQLSLMALVGPFIDSLWVRFGAALVVALVVPAVISDRLLPETDPKPNGLVSTVFAVTWLAAGGLLVFATGEFGRTRLAAEGERLEAEGYGGPAKLSLLLAGGRGPSSSDASKDEVALTTPTTSPSGSEAETTASAPDNAQAPDPEPVRPKPVVSATAEAQDERPKDADVPPIRPPAGDGDCTYPEGPYGIAKGDVLSPKLRWDGYVPGDDEATTITIGDFFDCDGERGIDAIIIDTSQFG